MASVLFNDCFVSLGGTDLSAYVQSVALPQEVEQLDETAMGDTTRKNKPGLKSWTADIQFKQDFAAGAVDATLFPLLGTTFTLIVRPVKATAVGATNPNYTGTGSLASYDPFGGSVGDLATTGITINSAGTMTRAVA